MDKCNIICPPTTHLHDIFPSGFVTKTATHLPYIRCTIPYPSHPSDLITHKILKYKKIIIFLVVLCICQTGLRKKLKNILKLKTHDEIQDCRKLHKGDNHNFSSSLNCSMISKSRMTSSTTHVAGMVFFAVYVMSVTQTI
jgi:hypothetical protein